MNARTAIPVVVLVVLGLLVCTGGALYFIWPRNHIEVQLREVKRSPDGQWVAVVQLENYNTAGVVNDAVYAVRLKRMLRQSGEGDLVMNVPVIYPAPEPSIDWSNGTLVVTLANQQNYQYLATSVNGIAIVVRRGAKTGMNKGHCCRDLWCAIIPSTRKISNLAE